MNRDLPLIPVFIFLGCFILSIVIYANRTNLFVVPPVVQIFEQQGQIKYLFKNKISDIHSDREYLDMSNYGIDIHQGQVGVIKGGGLIVNQGGQSNSLLKKIAQYLRLEEGKAQSGKSSLLLCEPNLECRQWGDLSLQFDRAWSMFEVEQGFVVNDIARHKLHLVNNEGKVLDVEDGFRFPNHLLEYQGTIWVVNTNTNSLIELDILDDQIKRTGKSIRLRQYKGITSSHRFPSIAYSIPGADELILLTHTSQMNQGQVFRVKDGEATRLFSELKDITSLHVNDETIYVADFNSKTFWQYDYLTGQNSQLENASFDIALEQAKSENDQEWSRFVRDVLMIMSVGVLALVLAVTMSKPQKSNKIAVKAVPNKPIETSGEIQWVSLSDSELKRIDRFRKVPKNIAIFVGVGLMIFLTLLVLTGGEMKPYLPIVLLISIGFIVALPIFIIVNKNLDKLKKRIGWDGEYIHLQIMARQAVVKPKDIFYSQNQLFGNGVNVPIQYSSLGKAMFDKESFESIVCPLLVSNNELTAVQMIKHQFKNAGSDQMVVLALIPLIILVLILPIIIGLF